MREPFWVFEDIESAQRRRLFAFRSVVWQATAHAWLSIPIFATSGAALAFAAGALRANPATWPSILAYGLLLYLTNVVHTLGHLLSGALVGRPMDGVLVTATFDVNLYSGDQSGLRRRVHVARALGGPLLNLLAGIAGLAAGPVLGSTWLQFFGYASVASALWTLLPIAPMDGWVLWHMRGDIDPRAQGAGGSRYR